MIRGGCLCGSVRYEIRGAVGKLVHCHCSMCRKAHGAAFGSYGVLKTQDFVITAGEGDIVAYDSSPGVQRTKAPWFEITDGLPQHAAGSS